MLIVRRTPEGRAKFRDERPNLIGTATEQRGTNLLVDTAMVTAEVLGQEKLDVAVIATDVVSVLGYLASNGWKDPNAIPEPNPNAPTEKYQMKY
jgi:hypothetical protein